MIETIAISLGKYLGSRAGEYAVNKVFDILWQKVIPKDDVEKAVDDAFRKAMHNVFPQRDLREVMTPEFKQALERMIVSPNVQKETDDEEHGRVYTFFMQYLAESAPFASQYVHEVKSERRYNEITSLLLQLINVPTEKKIWENTDNIIVMFYATMLGGWNSSVDNDKELISNLCGLRYEDFELNLAQFLEDKEFPITRVGTIWQVKSPYTQMQKYAKMFTPAIQDKVKECVDWLMEDDDPDAKAKMDTKELKYWKDRHVFSSYLKEGLFRGITALSVILEDQGTSTRWIDELIASKLREFGLVRYLSNRSYLEWFSESSPSAFISFLENEIQNGGQLFDVVFKHNKKRSIFGGGIYYPELLFCLEKLAWNEQYLPQVTELLVSGKTFKIDKI